MIQKLFEESKSAGKKMLALLIDPDKTNRKKLLELLEIVKTSAVDLIFVGGSLMTGDLLDECLRQIRQNSDLPVVLFPGSPLQISKEADGILFLSLISGRNPELLIGNHVIAAPYLKSSGLEVLPTGYLLVDGGAATTASYISNTTPIPSNKPEIASCTAMAGEMLGLQMMYLDAGSGANQPVPKAMIAAVRKVVDVPLIVGGGIDSGEKAEAAWANGADVVVVGNAIEKNSILLNELTTAASRFSK